MNSNKNTLPKLDVSLEELVKSSSDNNSNLVESLKSRFSNDLILNMIFFLFNTWAHHQKESGFGDTLDRKTESEKFFDFWYKETKKQVKKELLEINNKMKTGQLEYLGAISKYSLPSTEDYQCIYNEALKETREMFERNTKTQS